MPDVQDVFEILAPVDVRKRPTHRKGANAAGWALAAGDCVSGREVACHLSGACFVELSHCEYVPYVDGKTRIVKGRSPVEVGSWTYRVSNSAGLALRCHPAHKLAEVQPEVLFPDGALVHATARVRGKDADVYVRVQDDKSGREGWLFETREGTRTLEPVGGAPTRPPPSSSAPPSQPHRVEAPPPRAAVPLDVGRVRAAAVHRGYAEVQYNQVSRVIAFRREGVRVNVCYTTGTVGTCLDHPSKGKTALFRRGVTLAELERIFDDPRVHTGIGYYRRGEGPAGRHPQAPVGVAHALKEPAIEEENAGDGEAAALARELKRVEGEVGALVQEHAELLAHLRALNEAEAREREEQQQRVREEDRKRREAEEKRERERVRKEAAEQARRKAEEARLDRGTEIWVFTEYYEDEIVNSNDLMHVAIVDEGQYIVVESDGEFDYKGIPDEMHETLLKQNSLAYAALGPDDQYFIDMGNRSEWVGPQPLHEALQRTRIGVKCVAFGRWGRYFVVFDDGDTAWNDLPRTCHNWVNGQRKRKVAFASLGPNEEWFVRFADGGWKIDGGTSNLYEKMDEIEEDGGDIKQVHFGSRGNWVLRYNY